MLEVRHSIKPPTRKNGFESPFHALQILTWVLYPSFVVYYFMFLMQMLWTNTGIHIFVTFMFCLFSLSTAVFGYIVCDIDPSVNTDTTTETPNPQNIEEQQTEDNKYCYVCEFYVPKSSHHCRYCHKCIDGFDHHCKWLNTCIGCKNYRYFLLAMLSACLLVSLLLTVSISLAVEIFSQRIMFRHRLQHSHFNTIIQDNTSLDALGGIIIGCSVFLAVIDYFIIELGCLHIYLIYNGMTTYEFNCQMTQQRRDREAQRVSGGDSTVSQNSTQEHEMTKRSKHISFNAVTATDKSGLQHHTRPQTNSTTETLTITRHQADGSDFPPGSGEDSSSSDFAVQKDDSEEVELDFKGDGQGRKYEMVGINEL